MYITSTLEVTYNRLSLGPVQKVTVKTNKKTNKPKLPKCVKSCTSTNPYLQIVTLQKKKTTHQNVKQHTIYAKVNWNSLTQVALAVSKTKQHTPWGRHWSHHLCFHTIWCESPTKICLETELRYRTYIWSLQLVQLHTVRLQKWYHLVAWSMFIY